MYGNAINYQRLERREGGEPPRWQLANVGFWLNGVPRIMLWCRMFGHRPVVDATWPTRRTGGYVGQGYAWVACDRCGVRGDPQGSLDPDVHRPGQTYRGPWEHRPSELVQAEMWEHKRAAGKPSPPDDNTPPRPARPVYRVPGRIERRPVGEIGGQLVLGGGHPGWSWQFKVGNAGSEQTLAGHVRFGWLGGIYLHTQQFGAGLQRLFNRDGYESRMFGFEICQGEITWRVWSRKDGSRFGSDREPWWRYGGINLRVHDKLLGRRLYRYLDVDGGRTSRLVRMPEGDYMVTLQLQRVTLGRRRWPVKKRSWAVDWSTCGRGIPTRGVDRGRIYGSGVEVSARAVRAGTWPSEAAAAIAVRICRERTRHEWEPPGFDRIRVPVEVTA